MACGQGQLLRWGGHAGDECGGLCPVPAGSVCMECVHVCVRDEGAHVKHVGEALSLQRSPFTSLPLLLLTPSRLPAPASMSQPTAAVCKPKPPAPSFLWHSAVDQLAYW